MPTDAPLYGEPLPIELMNTLWADRAGLRDALLEDASGWLAAVAPRLPGAEAVTERQLGRLIALRDAVRCLAAEATADPRAVAQGAPARAEALTVLNTAAAHAPRWSELVWPGATPAAIEVRTARTAGDAAIALLAEEAVQLFGAPDRAELRACLAPGCVLYFAREQGRREWCSPACGNRARVARHYDRHHGAAAR